MVAINHPHRRRRGAPGSSKPALLHSLAPSPTVGLHEEAIHLVLRIGPSFTCIQRIA